MPEFGRWLDRAALAAYLHLRQEAITRMVNDGRLPKPSYELGERNPRWDRDSLDVRMSGGLASTNMDQIIEAWANGEKEIRRPQRQEKAR